VFHINEKIFCPNCGARILTSDIYCFSCGTELKVLSIEEKEPDNYETEQKSTAHENRLYLLYIALFVTIGALVLAIGIMLPHLNDLQNHTHPNGNYTTVNIKTDPPSALVKIDGVSQGLTPINNLPVEIGAHEIDVKLTGYFPCHEIRYIDNSTQELYYKLTT
jgi:hypothetical protein